MGQKSPTETNSFRGVCVRAMRSCVCLRGDVASGAGRLVSGCVCVRCEAACACGAVLLPRLGDSFRVVCAYGSELRVLATTKTTWQNCFWRRLSGVVRRGPWYFLAEVKSLY